MGRLKFSLYRSSNFHLGTAVLQRGDCSFSVSRSKIFWVLRDKHSSGTPKNNWQLSFLLKTQLGRWGVEGGDSHCPHTRPPPHNHESSSSPGGTVPVQCFVCFNSLWLGHLQKKAKLSHITGWHSCLLVLRNHSILLYIWILKFAWMLIWIHNTVTCLLFNVHIVRALQYTGNQWWLTN